MLPDAVARSVQQYLRLADRLLPGVITGFYVTGSVALGAYRSGRSDIDFVAVLDGDPGPSGVSRLRLLHGISTSSTGWAALRGGRSVFSGTCNGVFIRSDQLRRPASTIVPVASHCGVGFSAGRDSGVNPVDWKVLAEHGVAVRGPVPESLGLLPEPERLELWNRDNLESYWRPLAAWLLTARHAGGMRFRPRWFTAWGVLGPPRLHHTIATGDVISKEAAGEYALDVFGGEWHPIIREGLGYWRGRPGDPAFRDIRTRARRTAEFILHTIDSAEEL
jgi:hypothetical protein